MRLNEWLPLLACTTCGEGLEPHGEDLRCTVCNAQVKQEGGRLIFAVAPTDAPENTSREAANPSRWSRLRHANYRYLQEVLSAVPESSRIIDLGTGPNQFGTLTSRFAKILRIDFVPYQDVDVVANLNGRLPLAKNSIDCVLATNVLEHVPEPRSFLSEIHRVLRSGGTVIGVIPFMLGVHQRPYDFQRFTDIGLTYHLETSGFSNIEVLPLGAPLDLVATISQHYFQRLFTEARTHGPVSIGLLVVKLCWNIEVALRGVLRSAAKQPGLDPNFTLGYGFRATKR